jgi:predicted nuclease with RNAse H fold
MMAPTTLGIDLSAQPRETAACVIAWEEPARVLELAVGVDDDAVVRLVSAHRPNKVAIDAPFGWPVPFVRAVTEFTETGTWSPGVERRPLLLRTTDLVVREETGVDPLSVSSNLLAICAMRCAHLLARLHDGELDRTGAGLAVEVYPAGAMRQWGLDPRGYKGQKPERVAKRREIVGAIKTASSSWLSLPPGVEETVAMSDHCLDALVSAIVGHAVETGQTVPIADGCRELAAREGWIHLPVRKPLSSFDSFASSS